jgi:hypothetical protein
LQQKKGKIAAENCVVGWAGGYICSHYCIEQQPSITQKGNWARKKLIENMGGEGSVYEGVS